MLLHKLNRIQQTENRRLRLKHVDRKYISCLGLEENNLHHSLLFGHINVLVRKIKCTQQTIFDAIIQYFWALICYLITPQQP